MEELPAPWVALPGLSASEPCNQGAPEAYVVLNWLPFWKTLTDAQKADYLDRWEASEDWRHSIAERYDWDPAEMERDARESPTMPPRTPCRSADGGGSGVRHTIHAPRR